MPVDEASGIECFVIVEGRAVPEFPDAGPPRDWTFIESAGKSSSATKRRACSESARACPRERQHRRLLATSAGVAFEVGLTSPSPKKYMVETFVDGRQIDNFLHFWSSKNSDTTRFSRNVAGDYYCGVNGKRTRDAVRRMRFSEINSEDNTGSGSHAGRIDVVVRPVTFIGESKPAVALELAMPAGGVATAGAAAGSKKKVFGLQAKFDDAEETGKKPNSRRSYDYDKDTVVTTFSFRYSAIEALHIDKTNPKAWLAKSTSEIEGARQRSRDLRAALRAGYAISEPPSYLFNHKLSPLAGSGAPRAVADAGALDQALRGDGFKLCGQARGLFEALSHQLCGTHALARYVEHVVLEELEHSEEYGTWFTDFEDVYDDLFKPRGSPVKSPMAWRDHVLDRKEACGGTVCEGQRYDDAAALADDPPPLEPGDLVLVAPEDGVGDNYEASVQPGGDSTHVVVKELGKAPEAIRRSSPRLGGGGVKNRRGGYVALMQHAILQQAFCNAFGVRLFVTLLTRARKSTALRVVRVEPRAGRRVLINGYGIAHLGGNAFDSIERHHDVIEIASDDESADDAPDVKPDPEPQPPARKKARTSSPRVKKEKA